MRSYARVESVLAQTLEAKPRGAMHWRRSSMACCFDYVASIIVEALARRPFGADRHIIEMAT
jgi:hypothetical protein